MKRGASLLDTHVVSQSDFDALSAAQLQAALFELSECRRLIDAAATEEA